jgi:hypothetical protein
VYFNQALETRESYKFAGQTATLSAYYRTGSGFSGTGLTLNFNYGTGTDQNAVLGFTGAATLSSPVLSASNAWQRVTFSAFIPQTATQLSIYMIYTPSGTAGGFDYFDVTGVQLEKGSVATPYEIRPYATELALCQRYYYQMSSLASSVITANPTMYTFFIPMVAHSSVLARGPFQFAVTMRPTTYSFNATAASTFALWSAGVYTPVTSITYNNNATGTQMVGIDAYVASGLTAGQPYILVSYALTGTSVASIAFSAEL